MAALTNWASFYVITGSSAGALTGLTFVVISLVRETRTRDSGLGVAAYTSPTVVHFCEVLLVSAVLSAPWPALAPAAVTLVLCGLAGLGYTCLVVRRLRRLGSLGSYTPVLEDWLTHAILPLLAYATVIVAAVLLPANPVPPLFAIGAAMLVLLFCGIHNAWDTVTYMTFNFGQARDEPGETRETKE